MIKMTKMIFNGIFIVSVAPKSVLLFTFIKLVNTVAECFNEGLSSDRASV